MRLRYLAAPTVVIAALALASPASAGEVTGTGAHTPATSNAHSICVYSGLQDGDDNDDGIPEGPHGPGVTPQNWGHDKGAFGATPAERYRRKLRVRAGPPASRSGQQTSSSFGVNAESPRIDRRTPDFPASREVSFSCSALFATPEGQPRL